MVFVLTAGIGQALTDVLKRPSRGRSWRSSSMPTSPLRIVSIPAIDFPDTLTKFNDVDFWITSIVIVYPEGQIGDINVDFANSLTFPNPSELQDVMLSTVSTQREAIERELIEKLSKQIRGMKFAPRVFADDRPLKVFVVSHIRSRQPCFEIETQVTENGRAVWKQSSTNKFDRSCVKF